LRVELGQYSLSGGRNLDAWIEPNHPAYRHGEIRDSGWLCLKALEDSHHPAIDLRLETMSEDGRKLRDCGVGRELAEHLWTERQRYDERAFYRVHAHPHLGRLYFEPSDHPPEDWPEPIFVTARKDVRERLHPTIISFDDARQLESLFTHERLLEFRSRIPLGWELQHIHSYAQQMVSTILSNRAEFEKAVDWAHGRWLNEPHRYHAGPSHSNQDADRGTQGSDHASESEGPSP
jgi:hypothetical protein